ncbi:MAG: XRE family transcriptional regulator [Bacteroidetes bacterium]|nr:XRE family transcriptional regulator [Bacteroidota bacterium]
MKPNIFIPVNSKVLVWARETLALNRTNVAEKTGIPIKHLIDIEEGVILPSLDELKIFSKTYKRTLATLLLTIPPREKPFPVDRRTVNSQDFNVFHEKTIMAVRKARALALSLIELKEDAGIAIPRFQYRANLQDNPKEVAVKLHEVWGLDEIRRQEKTTHVFDAYIEKVESMGVAVFQLSLTHNNLRGFSIVDEIIPIIGIKRGSEQITAKIFTLFHEIGHIILNDGGLCDLSENTNQQIEKWCNAFAAEILIPTSKLFKTNIVLDYIDKGEKIWVKKDLIDLANFFHVGPLAILRSLLENNLTTAAFYKEKHQAWNKPSFGRAKIPEGRNIPKETISEKGRTYISLAFSAFDRNRIDLKDLSDFLGIKMSYIPKTRQLLNAL